MLKAIIVDDDKFTCQFIQSILKKTFPEINVVASVDTLKSAVTEIFKEKPSLLFLDIELPDGKGFEILNYEFEPSPKVIFITAHLTYGIPMYQYFPISFITKPIDVCLFSNAVKKAIESANNMHLMREFINGPEYPDTITVKGQKEIILVPTKDIFYLQADNNYTHIHSAEQTNLCVCRSLSSYHKLFCHANFLRVHQSFLVNAKKIVRISNTISELELCNKVCIPISKRNRPMVKAFVDSLEKNKKKLN